MKHIAVRPLNENDSIAEITDLLHRAFAKGRNQPYNYPAAIQSQDDTRTQIQRGNCWVATIDGRLVGVGIVFPPKKTSGTSSYSYKSGAHLRQLAVEPSLQSMGIGMRILDICERSSVEMNASELWGSSPVGSRQISFYRRRGYRILEYVSWPNTDYVSVIFSKCLGEVGGHNVYRSLLSKVRYYRSVVMYKVGILRICGKIEGVKKLLKKLFRHVVWVLSKFYLICRLSRRRDVLLCCNSPLMTDYLGPFWELFEKDKRLKFHVVFLPLFSYKHSNSDLEYMRNQLPVAEVSENWAYSRAWDLVVCADHCFGNARRKSPTVYIGHGPKCKVLPGELSEYAYGKHAFDSKARLMYCRMFEEHQTDSDRVIQENPALKNAVVVVGNLENDKLLAQMEYREEFRRQFGFGHSDVVVFVVSTWGKHSLFHTMGDEFLEEARKLKGEFTFILSTHPNEYRPKPNGQRVWGEYLRTQRKCGFIVREPSENWMPYMVASDIIIGDYTGLVEYAALLEKSIILTPVPKELIWEGSVTWEIHKFAPVLKDARMLGEYLRKAMNNYPMDKLQEIAQTIHPHPGKAASRMRKEIYELLRIPAQEKSEV